MTELIKIGILYIIFIVTAIYATEYYKKIFKSITKHIEDIATDKIQNRQYRIRLGTRLK